MSDPKRATLITVGATKNEKNKVNKTVRLTINLDESNESKYPELNYKELVIAQVRKKVVVENGKAAGLNPYSDNDEDVERVARKFEQKYGGNSTYGKKGKSKHDDFADIGAGYDENDSFIDNTDGYDEMIPPECETFHGGFYINSGLLEFKNADNQSHASDGEIDARGRNKRRISSSSSDDDSSDSSSESESHDDDKDPKGMVNGTTDSHKTEHRKKKSKKHSKKKAKKIHRTDSSAATSGKQTSDDNGHGEAESVDSRTSDSLASKPAPSSENAVTSDSSRDMESKVEVKLPPAVSQRLEELESAVSLQLINQPGTSALDMETLTEEHVVRLQRTLSACTLDPRLVRLAWARGARALAVSRARLLQRARRLTAAAAAAAPAPVGPPQGDPPPAAAPNPIHPSVDATPAPAATATATHAHAHKRKLDDLPPVEDPSRLTEDEREDRIVETLQRLKSLIEERKPAMMMSYNAECHRVQEERKKMQLALATDGAPYVEKRLPKRRFPWCPRSRALLARLAALAGARDAAAALLARRALPLFPRGFVRMPTLLRQADLSKEIKASELKRQRHGSSSMPAQAPQPMQFTEPIPIHFPSSLTVTTSAFTQKTSPEKTEATISTSDKDKNTSIFGNIVNSFSMNKDHIEKQERDSVIVVDKNDELYIPPNNFGCITITPVPSNQPKPCPDKKVNNTTDKHKEGLIRVKSPAALNEMVNKKEKEKVLENIQRRDKEKHKSEKNHSNPKDKIVDTPLHIDVSYQPKQKEPTPSPKSKAEEISKKQIENMRVAENNIPRPALVPVHLSPTFAKPDKRPPEIKKKKDIVIVSDFDPLADIQLEPVAVDDSSSDVELVEDSKSEQPCERPSEKSGSVPSRDKVSENHKQVDSARHSKDTSKDNKKDERGDKLDDAMKEDFNSLMKNLRDLENSQEQTFTSSTFGGVITSAKHDKSSSSTLNPRGAMFGQTRSDDDKFTERTSLNKMDGCSAAAAPVNPASLLRTL